MEITLQEYLDALSIVERYKRQESSKTFKVEKHSFLNDEDVKKQIPKRLYYVIQRCCEDFGVDWDEENGTMIINLENFSVSELKKIRGVGFKTISDLQQLCHSAGISLLP